MAKILYLKKMMQFLGCMQGCAQIAPNTSFFVDTDLIK